MPRQLSSLAKRERGRVIKVTSTPSKTKVTHSPPDSREIPCALSPAPVTISRASSTYDRSTNALPLSPITDNFSSTRPATPPIKVTVATPLRRKETDICISAGMAAQLFTNSFPALTSNELMFVSLALHHGINQAERLAAILHWRCQRPSQALRAMMNARA